MVNRWLHADDETLWRAVRSTLETLTERLDKLRANIWPRSSPSGSPRSCSRAPCRPSRSTWTSSFDGWCSERAKRWQPTSFTSGRSSWRCGRPSQLRHTRRGGGTSEGLRSPGSACCLDRRQRIPRPRQPAGGSRSDRAGADDRRSSPDHRRDSRPGRGGRLHHSAACRTASVSEARNRGVDDRSRKMRAEVLLARVAYVGKEWMLPRPSSMTEP